MKVRNESAPAFLGLKLPPDLLEAVRRAAQREDRTLSSFVRQALRAALRSDTEQQVRAEA